MTENSNVWLFFQRGGGWCYDEISCIERFIDNLGVSELVSSNLWPTERNVGGLFDVLQNANLVKKWHFVKKIVLTCCEKKLFK